MYKNFLSLIEKWSMSYNNEATATRTTTNKFINKVGCIEQQNVNIGFVFYSPSMDVFNLSTHILAVSLCETKLSFYTFTNTFRENFCRSICWWWVKKVSIFYLFFLSFLCFFHLFLLLLKRNVWYQNNWNTHICWNQRVDHSNRCNQYTDTLTVVYVQYAKILNEIIQQWNWTFSVLKFP